MLYNDILKEYISGKSTRELSKKYNISKSTILNNLKKIGNWDKHKQLSKDNILKNKTERSLYTGICSHCNGSFKSKHKRKYCSNKCIKKAWNKRNPPSKEYIKVKNERRRVRKRKKHSKDIWKEKYISMLKLYHKRNIDKIADKLLKKSINAKTCMVARSKKYNTECNITLDDIRQIILDSYGKTCKYDSNRIVTYKNMVFDHIIPVSKGGPSNKDNIQMISKSSNSIKGSLEEKSLIKLLEWLDAQEESFKKDIRIRLAGGLR